jgi:hypothetical protein
MGSTHPSVACSSALLISEAPPKKFAFFPSEGAGAACQIHRKIAAGELSALSSSHTCLASQLLLYAQICGKTRSQKTKGNP